VQKEFLNTANINSGTPVRDWWGVVRDIWDSAQLSLCFTLLRSEIRAACAQSFAPRQQATIEIMLAISLIIACSRYVYNAVILLAHPVRGESHNQRNTTGEVATTRFWSM